MGKPEPSDYILMFSSANVPGITYKINFEDCCPPFLKKNRLELRQGNQQTLTMRFVRGVYTI